MKTSRNTTIGRDTSLAVIRQMGDMEFTRANVLASLPRFGFAPTNGNADAILSAHAVSCRMPQAEEGAMRMCA